MAVLQNEIWLVAVENRTARRAWGQLLFFGQTCAFLDKLSDKQRCDLRVAHSLIYGRLRASLDELDEGDFAEGHELPGKWKIAKEMIGRRLCWVSSADRIQL